MSQEQPDELGSDEPVEVIDPVADYADREVGTETKHEKRADGSIAYFTEGQETDADRERAAQGIPEREVGSPEASHGF